MVPSLGNFTLWLSLCFAILQFIISYKKISHFRSKLNSVAVNGLLLCVLISFFSLMYSYVVSDFSVMNVFQNSHTTKPLMYKVSAVEVQKISNQFNTEVSTEKNQAEVLKA